MEEYSWEVVSGILLTNGDKGGWQENPKLNFCMFSRNGIVKKQPEWKGEVFIVLCLS